MLWRFVRGLSFVVLIFIIRPGITQAVRFLPAPAPSSIVVGARSEQPLGDLASRRDAMLPARGGTGGEQQGRLVYVDDFSDPSSGWLISDDAHVVYSYGEDVYRIRVEDEFYSAAVTTGIQLTNYVVEVDIQCVMDRAVIYGVAFGMDFDGTETYVLALNNRSEYSIWKYLDGTIDVILGFRYSTFIKPAPAWNSFRVIRDGVNITAEVNGQFLTTVQDPFLAGARTAGFGVISLNETPVEVRFDNFRLYTLAPEGTDYIKHKAVRATSADSGYEAEYAVDDDRSTSWTTSAGEIQVLAIDAGADDYVFDQVAVTWADGPAREWGLAAWNGAIWEIVGYNGSRTNVDWFELNPTRARYWIFGMIQWTAPFSKYAVAELRLLGPPEQNPNLALHKDITASATGEGSEPAFAVDGEAATQWISGSSGVQWLRLQLGQPLPFNRVTLFWGDVYPERYAILARGEDRWRLVASTQEGQGGTETFDFERMTGRTLLIVSGEPAAGSGYALRELGVWDTLGGGRLDYGAPSTVAARRRRWASDFPPLPQWPSLFVPGGGRSRSLRLDLDSSALRQIAGHRDG